MSHRPTQRPDAVCSRARRVPAKARIPPSAEGSLRASPEVVRHQHRADTARARTVRHTQNIERHRNALETVAL